MFCECVFKLQLCNSGMTETPATHQKPYDSATYTTRRRRRYQLNIYSSNLDNEMSRVTQSTFNCAGLTSLSLCLKTDTRRRWGASALQNNINQIECCCFFIFFKNIYLKGGSNRQIRNYVPSFRMAQKRVLQS